MKIEIMDGIPREIEERMPKDWKEYDEVYGVDSNSLKRFSITIKNKGDEIFGYLTAYTVFGEVYIDQLWIDADYRRKGFGRALILELEKQFEGKGFWNINLCTSEYQAPKFYVVNWDGLTPSPSGDDFSIIQKYGV